MPPRVALGRAWFIRDGIVSIFTHDVTRVFKLRSRAVDPVRIVVARRTVRPRRVVVTKEPRKETSRHNEENGSTQPNIVPPRGHLHVLQFIVSHLPADVGVRFCAILCDSYCVLCFTCHNYDLGFWHARNSWHARQTKS